MKRMFGIALLLLSAATAVRGAEVATTAGSTDLLFKFEGLSELGLAGPNGGLGLRYYVADRLALRPVLSFSWTRHRTRPPAGTPGEPRASDEVRIDTSVQLEIALERHLEGPPAVSPYLGLGLSGAHYDNKFEPGVLPGSPAGTLTKTTERGTNGALFAMLGFEWGWTASLTLGGETRFGLNVDTGKLETERVRTPDRLSNDFTEYRVGFQTVSLFLSVRV